MSKRDAELLMRLYGKMGILAEMRSWQITSMRERKSTYTRGSVVRQEYEVVRHQSVFAKDIARLSDRARARYLRLTGQGI